MSEEHNIQNFDCGKAVLNVWLKQKANKNQVEGGSRTFVVTASDRVVGYYSIVAGSVMRADVSGKFKRNTPDPIPVIILGRLAVDKNYTGRGIGVGLMKDCYLRVLSISLQIGVRALLVHALDEDARQYYLNMGFSQSPVETNTLMLTMEDIKLAA